MKSMKLYECLEISKPVGDMIKCLFYTYFALVQFDFDLVIILYTVMMGDMICGVSKALFLGHKVTIKRAILGFVVKLILIIIPLVVSVMGHIIGDNFSWTVDLVVKLMIINECLSILANVLSCYLRTEVENIDFISLIVKSIRNKAELFMNKILSK